MKTSRTRVLSILMAVIGVCVAGVVAASPAQAAVPAPDQDPFYTAPADIGSYANGAVVRSRSVDVNMVGIPFAVQAWQLLYKSTDTKGEPVGDVTTLMVPVTPWLGSGSRPLLSYQTAEDSLSTACAPSYSLRGSANNFTGSAEMLLMAGALLKGWAVVVPDYQGPQSQFTAGVQAGHAVLDSLRAATHFAPGGFNDQTSLAMWGYSGGGLASAWAAELQGSYAPELNIVGVAEGGVPADIASVAKVADGTVFSGIEFAGIVGLARAYPEADIASVVNAKGAQMIKTIGTMCIQNYVAQYAFQRLDDYTNISNAIDLPQFQPVLAADHLGQHKPMASIYDYHAIFDELVPIAPDDQLAAKYCAEGVKVQHVRDPLSEHSSLAVTGAPGALAYLTDRFAGRPAPSSC